MVDVVVDQGSKSKYVKIFGLLVFIIYLVFILKFHVLHIVFSLIVIRTFAQTLKEFRASFAVCEASVSFICVCIYKVSFHIFCKLIRFK